MGNDILIQQSNQQSKKSAKTAIAIIICVLVLVGLGYLVWSFIPKKQDRISVQNSSELGLSGKSFDDFRLKLISLLESENYINEGDEVDDVMVREGTVQSFWVRNDDKGTTSKTTSFLVDINSIKQTFKVTVYDYSGELTDLPVQISCPSVDEMKYPESECRGVYGSNSKSLRNNLPHELKLASGEKILVKRIDATRDGQQLVQVYLYSCETASPPIMEAEDAVRVWIKELGDSQIESYTYNIRTGYCEGDAI